MDEVPHRVVIHLETTLGQLGHQSAQGEGFLPDPVHKPGVVLAPDCLRLVPAHLPWSHTPGLPEAPNPGDGGRGYGDCVLGARSEARIRLRQTTRSDG